jgi:hypothetical protein
MEIITIENISILLNLIMLFILIRNRKYFFQKISYSLQKIREFFLPNINHLVPYVIKVENTTDKVLEAKLFGANRNIDSVNYGSDIGVIITGNDGSQKSYLQILEQSRFKKITTSLIRIFTNNPCQITQILNFKETDANGQYYGFPLITQSYFSPRQLNSNVLDVNYKAIINGNTEIKIKMMPNTTVSYTIYRYEGFIKTYLFKIKSLLKKIFN